MSHFKEICQYGFIHAQCRCPGDKATRTVLCDIPEHAALDTLAMVDEDAKGGR